MYANLNVYIPITQVYGHHMLGYIGMLGKKGPFLELKYQTQLDLPEKIRTSWVSYYNCFFKLQSPLGFS
jgi:hypothetical protein